MHYNYFRDYDAEIGRYLESDPIGLNGGMSTFGYVGGNPLRFADPYGLAGLDWLWGGIWNVTGGWSPDQSTVDFAAGFGDTISFGATSKIRELADIGSVNKCSSAYSNGEWTGIGLSVAFGAAHLGRNAFLQMGKRGVFSQRLTRGVGRVFRDNRSWGVVRNMWSRAAGNGTASLARRGQSLHHWLLPQRWGKFNASFNYLPISARFNSWMNNSTIARSTVEQMLKLNILGIYGASGTAAFSDDDCGCS